MASSGKKKTTMAKLTRESRLRERRLDKQAKKDARKRAAGQHPDQAFETPGTLAPDKDHAQALELVLKQDLAAALRAGAER